MVPAFLLADCIAAQLRGSLAESRGSATAVAAISAIWLIAGITLFRSSRRHPALARKLAAPLLVIYTSYAAIALAEIALTIIGVSPPIPGVQQPFTRTVTTMDPNVAPGVSGVKRFTINRLGLRGPMPPRDRHTYRIVAIGGSITLCSQLDDSETWPYATMQMLNASATRAPVWVGNAATAGANLLNSVVVTQWLPGILPADMWIFFAGANDLGATLALEGNPSEAFLEAESGYKGELPPGVHWRTREVYPLYRRLKLLLVLHQAADNLKQRLRPPRKLPLLDLVALRKRRAAVPVVPLPDLSIALQEYRSRIGLLIDRCRDVRVRCLFITEPTLWQDRPSPEVASLFWLGYFGRYEHPKGYVSSGDLSHAMDLYNGALLEMCREQNLECFDLASKYPKDVKFFMDDVHFNEAGSRLMAEMLKNYLLFATPGHSPASN